MATSATFPGLPFERNLSYISLQAVLHLKDDKAAMYN
jgi:hypothetical protein